MWIKALGACAFLALFSSSGYAAHYSYPQVNGLQVDATTWDYPGGDATVYQQAAADAYCRSIGSHFATNHGTVDNGNWPNGTWRFYKDGSGKFCDFCKSYMTFIDCQ